MSFVQLFVEDKLTDPYEILAARALGVPTGRAARRRRVRAARLGVNEFTHKDSLLDTVQRAFDAGSRCVFFILDEEDYNVSPDRPGHLAEFRAAFDALCHHLEALPPHEPLKQVKVTRVVSKTCLECWLLADPHAIVVAVGGPSSYRPSTRNTEHHNPRQAREQMAHIVQQVGNRTGKQRLARTSSRSVKTMGVKIAPHIVPDQARRRNFSLAYFYDMITCQQSGCERPFPEPD
jgi:hypothetical protein